MNITSVFAEVRVLHFLFLYHFTFAVKMTFTFAKNILLLIIKKRINPAQVRKSITYTSLFHKKRMQ